MKKLVIVLLFIAFQFGLSQWELCNNGLGPVKILSIAISGDTIFVGTEEYGIYLSTDMGESWAVKNNGLTYYKSFSSMAIIGNNVFAGCDHGGLFLSTDMGSNWSPIKNGLNVLDVLSLAYKDDYLFAASFLQGLYRSSNMGKSWMPCEGLLSSANYVMICGDNVIAASGYGTHLSTDMGNTWELRNRGLSNKNVVTLGYIGEYLFASSMPSGIYMSTNLGSDWIDRNKGVPYHQIRSFVIDSGYIFGGARFFGVIMSTDLGETWSVKNDGILNTDIFSLAVGGEYIFAGTIEGLYKAKLSYFGVTDVDEGKKGYYESISLSPNPASDYIDINIGEVILSEAKDLKIYNSLGECVLTPLAFGEGTGVRLDVSGLPPGVYVVTFSKETSLFIKY